MDAFPDERFGSIPRTVLETLLETLLPITDEIGESAKKIEADFFLKLVVAICYEIENGRRSFEHTAEPQLQRHCEVRLQQRDCFIAVLYE